MAPPKRTKSHQEGLKYDEIQEECFNAKTLFEDTAFPAAPITISIDLGEEIKWLRPSEIVEGMEGETAPEFVVDGASRHDINQGRLGNCWLMAGIAALCENEKLFDKVVDPDQGFDEEKKYCGVFRFRFWRFGDWVEVCVDDRLPTINGNLVFLQSQGKSKNEFWPALFEKAYAKIYGSYAGLKGGQPIVAMRDFTGGVLETYNLKKLDDHPNLHETLKGALEKGALVGAGINPISSRPGESLMPCGLIAGHAYSLTCAMMIKGEPLVRVRNPHGGRGVEWNGAWSDDCRFMVAGADEELSTGWTKVDEAVLNENLLTVFNAVKDKGEGLVSLEEGCCAVTDDPQGSGFTEWASCNIGSHKFSFGQNVTENPKQKIVYKRGSEEWNSLNEEEKASLGLALEQDGEFWMSFHDFTKYFDDVQVCNLSADNLEDDDDDDIGWKLQQFHGKWVKDVNAGGCMNNRETFYTNPQVYVVLRDIETDNDDLSSCLIALMHKETEEENRNKYQSFSRGVSIFSCKPKDEERLKRGEALPIERFNRNPVAKVPFTNARETSKRFNLPPGPYVLVPSTFKAGTEGEFLLRIFSETDLKKESDTEDELEAVDDFEGKILQCGTQIQKT